MSHAHRMQSPLPSTEGSRKLMVYLRPLSSAYSRVSCDTIGRSMPASCGSSVAAGLPAAVVVLCLSHQRVRLWCASSGRSLTDRLATNLPQPCSCHTHMQRHSLALLSDSHAPRTLTLSLPLCSESSHLESCRLAWACCFNWVVSSDRWVLFEICIETLVAFVVAFVRVKATF